MQIGRRDRDAARPGAPADRPPAGACPGAGAQFGEARGPPICGDRHYQSVTARPAFKRPPQRSWADSAATLPAQGVMPNGLGATAWTTSLPRHMQVARAARARSGTISGARDERCSDHHRYVGRHLSRRLAARRPPGRCGPGSAASASRAGDQALPEPGDTRADPGHPAPARARPVDGGMPSGTRGSNQHPPGDPGPRGVCALAGRGRR
jgi:hypothetical protein